MVDVTTCCCPPVSKLERARTLLADPGDITTDDIKEFISLSSAREETERKEREEALERDKAQVARIARSQRITRWAFAAVAAVVLIAGGIVAWWQADKARLQADKAEQLAKQEVALARAQGSVLGELSRTKLLRGEIDSTLRLASRGTRIDL